MRNRLAYALAAIIFGVSLIGYIDAGVTVSHQHLQKIGEAISAMPRASIPGESDVRLPDPGEYTIFYERPSGQTGNDPPEMRIELLTEDGGLVQTRSVEQKTTYEFDSSGVSVQTFHVSRPGVYRVVAAYPEGSGEPPAVLAFGTGLDKQISEAVGTGVRWLLWSAGIAAAVAIAALTYFRQPDPLPSRATRP